MPAPGGRHFYLFKGGDGKNVWLRLPMRTPSHSAVFSLLPPAPSMPSPQRNKCSTAGFTAIEVFTVIALLGALFVLAIANMDFVSTKWTVRPARENLISTIGQAHNQSRLHKEDLFLRYDGADNALYVETATGEIVLRTAIASGEISAITFYRILPEKERSDRLTREPEEDPVPTIRFSPSGSATPTLIELDTRLGRQSLIFDPFSLKLVQDAQE